MMGFIYVIRSHQTDDVYYGSTIQTLCIRMSSHRRRYKQWLNSKSKYQTSFELLKHNDAYIELVEEVIFENKYTLLAREGYYIRQNNCVNKIIPCRTDKQYYEDNVEKIALYRKENKDKKKEYDKIYRELNKDAITKKKQDYNDEHRDEIKQYNKRYHKSLNSNH